MIHSPSVGPGRSGSAGGDSAGGVSPGGVSAGVAPVVPVVAVVPGVASEVVVGGGAAVEPPPQPPSAQVMTKGAARARRRRLRVGTRRMAMPFERTTAADAPRLSEPGDLPET